jgi:hypothetical protein
MTWRRPSACDAPSWRLLLVAYKTGWVDADTLWGYTQTLRRQNRGAPPGVTDHPSFNKWLGIATA